MERKRKKGKERKGRDGKNEMGREVKERENRGSEREMDGWVDRRVARWTNDRRMDGGMVEGIETGKDTYTGENHILLIDGLMGHDLILFYFFD